ncbi:serine/threonine protein kinase [Nostoc sp. NIES-3756]|uniref:GUN4 domain-containing protein n=1 Tax=Nostoc sp. NIES-3756 TaxID=1751286 RepID=UPI00071FA877|nr:GUN4 domain-containing protein [Nostoc sp. NIES-3756]BAT51813.1 serine/threonine protein kinase [Nostoc sp. NIES-3756]
MVRGDHIYINDFNIIPFTHHGIDCGDGTVIHYTGESVCRISIYEFSKGKKINTWIYDNCDHPDLVLLRAESRLGERNYHLILNNCEHFANWCKTGIAESEQVKLPLNLIDFFNWRMEERERQSYQDLFYKQNEILRKLEKQLRHTKTIPTNQREKVAITGFNNQTQANRNTVFKDSLATDKFDYRTLQALLQEGYWQEADEFTFYAMLKISNREYDRYFRLTDIANFPREDLLIIDKLWREHSRNSFGFSVQKEIYRSLGGNQNYEYEIWERFSNKVGWRVNEIPVSYEKLCFSIHAPKGHFPHGKRIGSEIIGFLAII